MSCQLLNDSNYKSTLNTQIQCKLRDVIDNFKIDIREVSDAYYRRRLVPSDTEVVSVRPAAEYLSIYYEYNLSNHFKTHPIS